jgi:hypothetical protein
MPTTPLIVHKVHDNSNSVDAGDGFSDLQVDAIATAMAGLRAEIRDETQAAIATAMAQLRDENDLTEAVAQLRGQVSVLLNLIGGNSNGNGNGNNKLLEASSEIVRKRKVQSAPRRRMRQAKAVDQNGSPAR